MLHLSGQYILTSHCTSLPAFVQTELSAGWRAIYGPARAVKGLSSETTRFRTDAVIYPTSW
jgi:hypothetical protein